MMVARILMLSTPLATGLNGLPHLALQPSSVVAGGSVLGGQVSMHDWRKEHAGRLGKVTMQMRGPGPQGKDEGDNTWWGPDDDNALQAHINAQTSSVARLGHPQTVMSGMDTAWVLIFNPGKHDEGVYTLQGRATSTSAYVLAFERTDDAERFAQLLQAEGFDLPTPLCWNQEQLSTFCEAGPFEVSLVPQGTLITPPTKNEYDHDAFDRLENGGVAAAEFVSDPERRFPGDGTGRLDPYAFQRQELETLFPQDANCGDDDCTLSDDPPPADDESGC